MRKGGSKTMTTKHTQFTVEELEAMRNILVNTPQSKFQWHECKQTGGSYPLMASIIDKLSALLVEASKTQGEVTR